MSNDINPFDYEVKYPHIHRMFELQTEDGVIRREHDGFFDSRFVDDEPLFTARIYFDDKVAKASEDGSPPDAVFDWKYSGVGKLIKITFLVVGKIGPELVELGEFENRKEAEALQRGYCHQCRRNVFEISLSHLPPATFDYLNRKDKLSGAYLRRMSIDGSNAIGFQLLSTPWTVDSLRIGLTDLKLQFIDDGMPAEFVDLLIKAGKANVRYLIFDKDAHVLVGLPLYGD